MIEVIERRRRPDRWDRHPTQDVRLHGLNDLSNLIREALDYATGLSDDDFATPPSELADLLRNAAENIELWTDDFEPDEAHTP